ncbi:Ig-like domain-containing protein [Nocardioides sp. AE5]|uniref:L,D-transpeptidase n=1 Tax=Nocardioides sp. AE5 TaxID=2962573 RepID=UPI002881A490|nr:Ig-like domain-containing protein [Nocardioides sp. AE5]MDT0201175.1 Ig-like domain-containing protein [Nocardioides sp. AE5]
MAAATALVVGALSACTGADADQRSNAPGDTRSSHEPSPTTEPVQLASNVDDMAEVPVDTLVSFEAIGGVLEKVTLSDGEGNQIAGDLAEAGAGWTASERLEPGTTYTLAAVARNEAGGTEQFSREFTTEELTLDQQTFASIAPLDGETVGIGMPVVVHFDLAVSDHATFEEHMSVTSTPAQEGSWHWVSDHEVHYRPAEYWQPGTKVQVDLDINALPAGNGIYGQDARNISFDVGEAVVSKVDAAAHTMQTYVNGKLVRTMQITTGKDGFTTRSGVKVIMEKHRRKRMNSETVGIPAGSAESYDIANVEYAMRVTNSGEFIHAAPWSAGSQGSANVSHGCTGMSLADAKWLYDLSKRGDVVEFTGTDRPMTLYNGYGDWNASFSEYAEGSAL